MAKKEYEFDEDYLERVDEHGYRDVRNGKLYWIEEDDDIWCKDMEYDRPEPFDPRYD